MVTLNSIELTALWNFYQNNSCSEDCTIQLVQSSDNGIGVSTEARIIHNTEDVKAPEQGLFKDITDYSHW